VHWKYKAIACLHFLTSGLLGVFAFDHESMINSPRAGATGATSSALGIFGASSLLLSLSTDTEIPEQEESRIKIPGHSLVKAIFAGSLGGSVVAGFRSLTSVASIAARLGAQPQRRSSWYPSPE